MASVTAKNSSIQMHEPEGVQRVTALHSRRRMGVTRDCRLPAEAIDHVDIVAEDSSSQTILRLVGTLQNLQNSKEEHIILCTQVMI